MVVPSPVILVLPFTFKVAPEALVSIKAPDDALRSPLTVTSAAAKEARPALLLISTSPSNKALDTFLNSSLVLLSLSPGAPIE